MLEKARSIFPNMTLVAITSMDIEEIQPKLSRLNVEVFSRPISVSNVHDYVVAHIGV